MTRNWRRHPTVAGPPRRHRLLHRPYGCTPYISRSYELLGKVALRGAPCPAYFAAAQIQMRANADNDQAGDPAPLIDDNVVLAACVGRRRGVGGRRALRRWPSPRARSASYPLLVARRASRA